MEHVTAGDLFPDHPAAGRDELDERKLPVNVHLLYIYNIYIWRFSKNRGTPKSSIFSDFPSILGYPHLWKPPYMYIYINTIDYRLYNLYSYDVTITDISLTLQKFWLNQNKSLA
jgi:hypothetical protein